MKNVRKCLSLLLSFLLLPGLVSCVEAPKTAQPDTTPAPPTTLQAPPTYTYEPFQTPMTVQCGAQVLVVDVVATNHPFNADPTGQTDSTSAINRALASCPMGGTVWLPAGQYLVSGTLKIPAFVTLAGDWIDPDEGRGYGTVLLATPPSRDTPLPALISIAGSAGVRGITVYYPQQDIRDVKPYPFTFYVAGSNTQNGYMLQSIIDCAVINGYRGLGACVSGAPVHEMMTVENFKGTFLYCAAEAYNQADVGTWRNVTVSPDYWADAAYGYACSDATALRQYTRKNTTALILGDLEWTQFSNVSVSQCATGVHLVKGKRIEFAGSFYNLNVLDCNVAFRADAIDTRWGALIAASSLAGSEAALINNTGGTVKLAGVTLAGSVSGTVDRNAEKTDLSAFVLKAVPTPSTSAVLFTDKIPANGQEDASAQLQALLDRAGREGGGLVYLPAGRYLLTSPITIPAGVELRGAGSVAGRGQSGTSLGTILLGDYGYDAADPFTGQALITLAGDRAAVSGLHIFYTKNSPLNATCRPCTYAIRGSGKGLRAENLSIAAAYLGIDFADCTDSVIKKVTTGCYRNAFAINGGCGNLIEGCLQNGTVITRHGLTALCDPWPDEAKVFELVFDPITRQQLEYIRACDTEDLLISNSFAYGAHTLISSQNSRVSVIGMGADNLGGPLLNMNGGQVQALNVMRWNGSSYVRQSGALTLFNRLTIGDKTEPSVQEN
ncbi:MAG: hypothetical protein IKD06_04145 [Clostridia bacterium]|nr:hypothetical protein [Clostridia bacterium]